MFGDITHTKSCDDGYVCFLEQVRSGPRDEASNGCKEVRRLEELKATLDAEQKRLNAEQRRPKRKLRDAGCSSGGAPCAHSGTSTFPAALGAARAHLTRHRHRRVWLSRRCLPRSVPPDLSAGSASPSRRPIWLSPRCRRREPRIRTTTVPERSGLANPYG